jgi:predicted nucleic acid-binding protein
MITGIDTGFFFALEANHSAAVDIWKTRQLVTSPIVLYELQKKCLQGHFIKWPTMIDDIKKAVVIGPLTVDIALKASHIAHGTSIPGLDALILSSLLEAGCKEIYTTDEHFELYKKKSVRIINVNCFRQ